MKPSEPTPVPNWVVERTGNPEDFDPIIGSLQCDPASVALNPDGFRWILDAELAGVREAMIDAYYEQRAR